MSGRVVFQAQPKRPDDIAHIPGIDFGPRLTKAGETLLDPIADAIVFQVQRDDGVALVSGDLTVLVSSLTVDATKKIIAFEVEGGFDNVNYSVLMDALTSTSRIEGAVVKMKVRERPS